MSMKILPSTPLLSQESGLSATLLSFDSRLRNMSILPSAFSMFHGCVTGVAAARAARAIKGQTLGPLCEQFGNVSQQLRRLDVDEARKKVPEELKRFLKEADAPQP